METMSRGSIFAFLTERGFEESNQGTVSWVWSGPLDHLQKYFWANQGVGRLSPNLDPGRSLRKLESLSCDPYRYKLQ